VTVEISKTDILATQCELKPCGYAQGRFVHAAHHYADLRGSGYAVHLDGFADAAYFHNFDVDQIYQPPFREPESIHKRNQAFIGHYRHGGPVFHQSQVFRLSLPGGLLQKFEVNRLNLADKPQCLWV
jgi:hypothetical protein